MHYYIVLNVELRLRLRFLPAKIDDETHLSCFDVSQAGSDMFDFNIIIALQLSQENYRLTSIAR